MKRYLLVLLTAIVGVCLFASSSGRDDLARAADEPTDFVYLPVLFGDEKKMEYDMAVYMTGDGRLYEVWNSINDSQARHQTQFEDIRFFHTKGENIGEWEELWVEDGYIMRGTDTSPGGGQYYTLRNKDTGNVGSRWSPRFWRVGDLFWRDPHVTFYWKRNCQPVEGGSGVQTSWLLFEAQYDQYTFESGITLDNVVQLAWLLNPAEEPIESYFYAENFGLVGWGSNDRGLSHITEIHEPNTRPPNPREVIDCLQSTLGPLDPRLPLGPLPPPYRAK